MTKFLNLFAIVVVVIAIAFTAFALVSHTQNAGASVDDISSASNATTTYYASVNSSAQSGVVLLKGATSTYAGPATGRMPGVLENLIVMGGPKGGTIQFYDATTSDVNLRTGNTSSSSILLAEYPAGIASTTFDMNISFRTGLLMVVTGVPATSTVTWK